MILIKNKKISETPLEMLQRLKKEKYIRQNSKATYAGRLDPMAQGLSIILTDKDCHHKEKFNKLDKTYQFEILQNIHTDSLDILGKIDKFEIKDKYINNIQILNFIKSLSPKYLQKYPQYSSKTFEGKQLHTLARKDIYPEIKHQVIIQNIKYLSQREINKEELKKEIILKIQKVNGDFRQQEIIKKWLEILNLFKENYIFTIYKFEIDVESGFYIRQLVDDISINFNTPMLTFNINRIKIGKYHQKNILFYNLYYKMKEKLLQL
jgi:tRNA pseudouridine(55) synthase